MRPLPRLAGVLAAAILCLAPRAEAAVTVQVIVAKDAPSRDARIDTTNALMKDLLEDCRQGFFDYPKNFVLKYDAAGWGVHKQKAIDALNSMWGKANVLVQESSASVEAAARRHPSLTAVKIAEGRAQVAAAVVAPAKVFDGSANRAVPVFVGGVPAVVPKPKAVPLVKKTEPETSRAAAPNLPPPPGTIPVEKLAAIIYGEVSTMRPLWNDPDGPRATSNYQPASELQLRQARRVMVLIADKRNGHGVAPPVTPDATERKNTGVAYAWKESIDAATNEKTDRKLAREYAGCRHFVTWPSDDGIIPTRSPRITDSWPYRCSSKIKSVFGPFRNPIKVGDVPKGDNIYTFVYCRVDETPCVDPP